MKKALKSLAIMLILLGMMSSILSMASAESYGIWERRAYVDANHMPTDDYYISNAEPLIGTYTNQVTSNGALRAYLIIDDDYIGIRLIEDGNIVTASSDGVLYTLILKQGGQSIAYVSGYMPDNKNLVYFYEEQRDKITPHLKQDGKLDFELQCSKDGRNYDHYYFTIEDTTGFNNFFAKTENHDTPLANTKTSLEEDLQGTWKMEKWSYESGSSSSSISSTLSSTNSLLQKGTLTWTYTFSQGTCTQNMTMLGVNQPTKGTYTVNGDQLTIRTSNGSETYTISINGTTLTLVENQSGLKTTFAKSK